MLLEVRAVLGTRLESHPELAGAAGVPLKNFPHPHEVRIERRSLRDRRGDDPEKSYHLREIVSSREDLRMGWVRGGERR